MAFKKLWVIAFRDLGRNPRRSLLTMLAVTLGLGLLIFMSGMIAGAIDGSMDNSIRLKTGHVQLRAASYDEARLSLQWGDLLEHPAGLLAQAQAQPGVRAAAPVLWAGGMLSTIHDSVGVQINGIDPASAIFDPLRSSVVSGAYLAPQDHGVILMGERLARELGLAVGDKVSLAEGASEGQLAEGTFTIQGLFATGVPTFDQATLLMSLSQAQAFTGAGDRASAIVIMLNRQEDASRVAQTLAAPGVVALTWREMHATLLQTFETSMSFYYLMYGIVILVVAVIITNTMLMAVFERTREMGILAALGLRGVQITSLVLFEAAWLAFLGALGGILLGSAVVAYLGTAGIYIGDMTAQVAENIAIGTRIYTRFVLAQVLSLSVWMLVITTLASLYPAIYAARLQPVKALHSL